MAAEAAAARCDVVVVVRRRRRDGGGSAEGERSVREECACARVVERRARLGAAIPVSRRPRVARQHLYRERHAPLLARILSPDQPYPAAPLFIQLTPYATLNNTYLSSPTYFTGWPIFT